MLYLSKQSITKFYLKSNKIYFADFFFKLCVKWFILIMEMTTFTWVIFKLEQHINISAAHFTRLLLSSCRDGEAFEQKQYFLKSLCSEAQK